MAGWRAGKGSVRGAKAALVCHRPVMQPKPPALPELAELDQEEIAAKRILVKEKRYACCIRGGCHQCVREGGCDCGADLAKDTTSQGKRVGVCGDCFDGWKAGIGLFPGIPQDEVALAEMGDSMAGMSPDTSASSGWYVSGTALAPRASPFPMLSWRLGNWNVMLQGLAFLAHTNQTGERGRDKLFGPNWFMPMVSRRLGPGILTFRSMFSLDPLTVSQGRYPLIFQEGETWKNVPIINGQHPHDFVMELAASYQLHLGERTSLMLYGGPRGEPAFGTSAYPHRVSQSENPIAVSGHHFQDSTHISNTVATIGLTHGPVTLEASGFHGREPDERRWNLERGGIDSFASRVTFSPTPRWTAQFSVARINNRESTHPLRDSFRQSASVTYVRPLSTGHWATTALWGRNHDLSFTQLPQLPSLLNPTAKTSDGEKRNYHIVQVPTRIPGQIYNSYLIESTLLWRNKNWIWGRAELSDKDSLLLFTEEPFVRLVEEQRYTRVRVFTMGYSRELTSALRYVRPALGSQVMLFDTPPNLRPIYGRMPVGVQIFLRARIGSTR